MPSRLPPIAPDADVADTARQIGFAQCVHAIRNVLATTPVGNWARGYQEYPLRRPLD